MNQSQNSARSYGLDAGISNKEFWDGFMDSTTGKPNEGWKCQRARSER
jgi:hypothetical protein